MKKYIFIISNIALLSFILTSCGDDFLTTSSITQDQMGVKPITAESVNQNLASAYHVLLRDNYADGYNDLWLISDLRSDDIFRGGAGASDQPSLYYLAQFTSTPQSVIGGIYQLFWRGVARCNETVANADIYIDGGGANVGLVKQYKAEAIFLRAYYHHVMWKNWGNIPYLQAPLTEPFVSPQLSADEVYAKLMEDIKECENLNALEMKSKDIARINKAALYMLKADVVMYQKDQSKYGEVAGNMAEIINSRVYELFPNFDAMWLDENEFCKESIFETNQGGGGMDWSIGAGNPWGFGTNLPRFIGPNDLAASTPGYNGGWGFAPVRPHLYAIAGTGALLGQDPIFEANDTRREASVIKWMPTNADIPAEGEYKARTHDTGFWLKKYAARKGYNPNHGDLGYINNKRVYRYAETLLNYAELVGVLGASASSGVTAQNCLDQVRTRAGVGSIAVNVNNIELERRREFIGEGRRYWDLVRWGKAATALTENLTWLNPLGGVETWERRWDSGKNMYLPFSEAEITATEGTVHPLTQNPY